MKTPTRNIVWFRRDLRIGDHPALVAALEGSDEIVPVFILNKEQIDEAGEKLLAYMGQSLEHLMNLLETAFTSSKVMQWKS
jgi:deoxyribodipyrimidine photo-lyase